jgi:hypothetical protein
MKGVNITVVAVTAIVGSMAVWAFDIPSLLVSVHDERAKKMFVSVEFIERQQYSQQIQQYDTDLNRIELEQAREGTSPKERAIYERQFNDTTRKKNKVIRDWGDRQRDPD